MQYLCGDLADPAFGMVVVTRCLTAFGHINGVAVNHAIIEPVGVAADIEVADWMATFNVNFFGSVALVGLERSCETANNHVLEC